MVLANRFTFFTLLISPKFIHGMGCLAAGMGQWLLRWLPTAQEGLWPQSITVLPSLCTLRSEAPSHAASHREPSLNSRSDKKQWEKKAESVWGTSFLPLLNFWALPGMKNVCCGKCCVASMEHIPGCRQGYFLRAWSWRSYRVLSYSLSANICCKGGRTVVFSLPLCLLLYAWEAGSEMSLLPPWGWKQTTCGLLLGPGLCAAGGSKKTQKCS